MAYLARWKDLGTGGFDNACSLFQIRADYLYDMIRSVIFSLILWYFSDYKETPRVPLRYVGQLQDFLNDDKCRMYFNKYLKHKGISELITETERINEEVLSLSQDRSILQFSSNLQQAFEDYQTTRSFKTLEDEIKIFGEVEALGYTVFR